MAIPKLNFSTGNVVDPTRGAMQGIAQARGALTDMVNQAYAEEDALRKNQLARDKMAQLQSNADRTYGLNEEKHKMDVADFNTKGLNYGSNNLTQIEEETVKVPGTLTDQQQAEIAALREKRAGLMQPGTATTANPMVQNSGLKQRTLQEMNLSPEYRKDKLLINPSIGGSMIETMDVVLPVDNKSTIPSSQDIMGIKLPDTDTKKQLIQKSAPLDISIGLPNTNKEVTNTVISPKAQETLTKPIKNEPKELDTQLKEIDAQIKKLSSPSPKTVTKEVVRLTKLDPNNINKTLTEQFKERFGREPDKYEISSIGARTKEVYQDLYERQQEVVKTDLDKRKAEANIRYMDAMAKAANRPKSSYSKEEVAAASKFDTGWNKNLGELSSLDVGSNDQPKSARYLQMMKSLNLPPELGEAVLKSPGVRGEGWRNWDRGITPESITSVTGLNAYDPVTGTVMGLGEALQKSIDEGWEVVYRNGSIQVLRPLTR